MPRIRYTSVELEAAARLLRKPETPAEKVLWDALRAGRLDGLKFRRQHPVGRFVLDFYCAAARLCVEVDGGIHDEQLERDGARDAALLAHGVRTMRFSNERVMGELANVLAEIRSAARSPA